MSSRTKSTVKMMCIKADSVMSKELPEEALKLLEVYNDPSVSPEQKKNAKIELDRKIEELENRVTTRRLNDLNGRKDGPSSVAS
jgi:hypothetical protein